MYETPRGLGLLGLDRRALGALKVLPVLTVLAAAGCRGGDPPAVLGGASDPSDPAVVAVTVGDMICTGTVIAPRYVLTAAHCFAEPGGQDVQRISVSWRASGVFGGDRRTRAARLHFPAGVVPVWRVHPDDLAVVELAEPTAVAAVPVNLSPAEELRVRAIRVVGYGQSGTNRHDAGVKRSAPAEAHASGGYLLTAPGSGTCFGDSGGPSLASIGGKEWLVAVTSGSWASTCERGSMLVRTDLHRAFLAPFVGEQPGDGRDEENVADRRPAPAPTAPPVAPMTPPVVAPPQPGSSSGIVTGVIWDRQSPLVCGGNEVISLVGVDARVPGGTAITATGHCQVSVVGGSIDAPVAIDARDEARVSLTGGTISAATPIVKSGSARVDVTGTGGV